MNALVRLDTFLTYKAKVALVQSFVLSNFNYCPLEWHFSSTKSLLKVERIQKRALRFLFDDSDSTYEELLLKSGRNFMSVYRLKTLCTEIYKSLHSLNSSYIHDIFDFQQSERSVRSQNVNNLKVPRMNTRSFGTKSLTSLGPNIWNKLPNHMKTAESLNIFKKMIKFWNGQHFSCDVCSQ